MGKKITYKYMTIDDKRKALAAYDPAFITWIDDSEATDIQVEEVYDVMFGKEVVLVQDNDLPY